MQPLTASDVQKKTDVSRETLDKLEHYSKLLSKWQKAINLVGNSTLQDMWRRHFLDSLQLLPYLPEEGVIVDMGSGAGFPGLVLSVCGRENIHLIESDQRKSQFLRTVIRENEASANLHVKRIEEVSIANISCVTARALASLESLVSYAWPFIRETNGKCLFLKGQNYKEELEELEKNWNYTINIHDSQTDDLGKILEISAIQPK